MQDQEGVLETAQRLAPGRLESRRGMQLVKGAGTTTLAPGNLGAVRERLSMPAPAAFEEHDPWALRRALGQALTR